MTLIALLILIPLATASVCLLIFNHWRWQRWLSTLGALVHFGVALFLFFKVHQQGALALEVGQWPAPFGIVLVADSLSTLMVLIAALISLLTQIYSLGSMDATRKQFGYYPLIQILTLGVVGAFLTGDVFNLYVSFELMLISSFVLLALGGKRAQIEGSIKYVTINLLSSALFLTAIGLTYAMTGALNLARLAELIPHLNTGQKSLLAILYLTAFGIKAGIFPLFFWLPASYHTPPASISAIFAGLLTKVGVYTLIRFFTLIFGGMEVFDKILLVLACFTMVTGVLGAASQMGFRRILSFHIISQIGYMILGLSLKTPLGLLASVFYIAHHILVKTNLFFASGLSHRLTGHYNLNHLGGLYGPYPLLSFCFALSAFSLAGVPPLSGFFAKLLIIQASLETHHYWVAGIALFVGFLTLYSMAKIWSKGFWEDSKDSEDTNASKIISNPSLSARTYMLIPMVVLSLMTLSLGIFSPWLYRYSKKVATDLENPQNYINLVLKKNVLTKNEARHLARQATNNEQLTTNN